MTERADVEVDQQSQAMVGGLKVREHLGDVKRHQFSSRLQFDHQSLRDEQIEPAVADRYVLVGYGDRCLAFERYATELELECQGLLIHGLSEPGAELAMNFQSGVDHDVCEPIQLRIGLDEFTRSTVSRRHANASATHVRDCVLGGSEEVMNRQGSAKGRQKEGVIRQGSAKDARRRE
jgi:hypothetical protein